MSRYQIFHANWKGDISGLEILHTVTTMVIEQDGIYFDPSNTDFLGAVFKEFVRQKMGIKETITLKLTDIDLFFYGENANVYLLNYIYSVLYPDKEKKVFDPVLECDEGNINIGLFNAKEEQLYYLLEILESLTIDFKVLYDKYMMQQFPDSLEYCDEIRELEYIVTPEKSKHLPKIGTLEVI